MGRKIAAPTLIVLLLWLLQLLLVPKYMDTNPEGALVSEYYSFAGGNDVIFVGDCEVYETFSPITLWQEYGITSCVRGSPQQTIWQSYYLMEDIFRHETPKVMVFNVLSMKYDTVKSTGNQSRREALNRMTLDGMDWSISKWKSIFASMTEEEWEKDGIFTYLFPILRYHSRWRELTQEDVRYLFHRDRVSHNGYLMQTGVKPLTDAHVSAPLADYTLGDKAWNYLEKMVQLCEKHGTQLVLVKSPVLYPVWWWEWDAQVRSFAEEKGIPYINMLPHQEEIGIDWSKDTYDTGLHLNVWGAEKASRWFGGVLSRELDLPDRRQEENTALTWQKKTAVYLAEREGANQP